MDDLHFSELVNKIETSVKADFYNNFLNTLNENEQKVFYLSTLGFDNSEQCKSINKSLKELLKIKRRITKKAEIYCEKSVRKASNIKF